MAYSTVFKRYELKYLITTEQRDMIKEEMAQYMTADKYGKSTIRNIYFDTPDYRLIRRSIEKPEYKEKLRIRSYQKADKDTTVFVELKKKYKKVVYKRRIAVREEDALSWIYGHNKPAKATQITKEIDYFIDFYKDLQPTVFLSYSREAFYSKTDSTFRVTFDTDICCRFDALTLESESGGTPILGDDKVLMEIKCAGGIPLWMAHILSREKIVKTSFSKYGTAYTTLILPNNLKETNYA